MVASVWHQPLRRRGHLDQARPCLKHGRQHQGQVHRRPPLTPQRRHPPWLVCQRHSLGRSPLQLRVSSHRPQASSSAVRLRLCGPLTVPFPRLHRHLQAVAPAEVVVHPVRQHRKRRRNGRPLHHSLLSSDADAFMLRSLLFSVSLPCALGAFLCAFHLFQPNASVTLVVSLDGIRSCEQSVGKVTCYVAQADEAQPIRRFRRIRGVSACPTCCITT